MNFQNLLLVCFMMVRLFNLQASDVALTACDTSEYKEVVIGQPCPYHSKKTVSSCVNSDGRVGHTHQEDGISMVYWQDNTNYTMAYAAGKALRGSY